MSATARKRGYSSNTEIGEQTPRFLVIAGSHCHPHTDFTGVLIVYTFLRIWQAGGQILDLILD
jgi:hypothetical protein